MLQYHRRHFPALFFRGIIFSVALAFCAFRSSLAYGDVLVSDFTGTSPGTNTPWTSTSFLAPGVDYTGWTHGPGTTGRVDIDNAFGFQVSADSGSESSLQDSITEGEYLGFTISPQPSTTLELAGLEIEIGIRRNSWFAPRQYSLFSSVDGFSAGNQLFTTGLLGHADQDQRSFRFFIPATGYGNITAPVEFRLYAYSARYDGHATSLTNFSITRFSGNVYSLSVSGSAGGSATATPATSPLREGELVTLAAEPDEGYRFLTWSGSFSGKGNPLLITMDSDKTLVAEFEPRPSPQMRVGMNPSTVTSWGTEWPFVDLFRRTAQWWTRNADGSGPWESGLSAEIPGRPDGYPTHLPFTPTSGVPQIVHTVLSNFPSTGTASLFFEGTGRMRSDWGSGTSTWHTASGGIGRFDFTVAEMNSTFILELHESSTTDPLRNIRLVAPGFLATHDAEPFHPLFLERLSPFSLTRHMNWQAINGSPAENWADRTLPESYTQSSIMGVALEVIADLSNTLQQDAWICIPHRANDDYVRQAARLLRDTLDPSLKLYVEYSNETWNTAPAFPQTAYVQDQGESLAMGPDRWTSGQYFAAVRSAQIWKIFQEEFGSTGANRLVNVLAAQSGNLIIADMRFAALNNPALNPDRIMPDVLAIAPYFGIVYTPAQIAAEGYPTVDDLLTTISQNEIQAAQNQVSSHRQLADRQGCALICYEGGQHFVGAMDAENDDLLTAILIAANRDQRMHGLYIQYLDMLKAEGVELFANYSYVREPSKWGSWGVLEYQDQPLSDAPKYQALIDWLAQQPASNVPDWALY